MLSNENQIAWVTLTLEFPDELEAHLEKAAKDAGLSVKCYCVRILLKHWLESASDEQKERWQQQVPATLRRNGCDDSVEL